MSDRHLVLRLRHGAWPSAFRRASVLGSHAVLIIALSACSGDSGDGTPNDGSGGGPDSTLGTETPDPPTDAPDGSNTNPDPANPTATGTLDPANPDAPLDPSDPTNTDPDLPGDPSQSDCVDGAEALTGANVLRRLSRLEYQLSLQDLLQLPQAPSIDLIPDDAKHLGFRTVSTLQNVSSQHLRGFADQAALLSAELMADAARRDAVIGCDVATAGCLAEFTGRFGRLAFRRSLTDEEVSNLTARASEVAESPSDEAAFVLEALLTSPSFLYRVEVGNDPEALSTLSGAELASKLSFSILGRTPSDELLSRGESGELDTAEGLLTVADELVRDPRAQQYFDAFFRQWLDFEQLRSPPEPPPGWSDDLLGQMLEETELVLNDFAWGGGDFLDALTANYSYVSPELAGFYGIASTGAEATRVEFPVDHQRYGTGLLTHASLISAKGDGDLIAHRGKWLFSTFLCQNLEIPAGLLDNLGDEFEGLSPMEMLAKRNEQAPCDACHGIIDPIGIGFAQYDGTGQFDPSVNLSDYPLAPALDGSVPPEFSSIAELAAKLRARPEISGCMTERVFLYTQGREPLPEDACGLEQVNESFAAASHDFQKLLLAMVTAPEFRLRQAPTPSTQAAE